MITKTRSATASQGRFSYRVTRLDPWNDGLTLPPVPCYYPPGGTEYNAHGLTESISYTCGAPHNYCLHTKRTTKVLFGTVAGVCTAAPSYPNSKWLCELTNPGQDEGIYENGCAGGTGWFGSLPPSFSSAISATWQSYYSAKALQVMWPRVQSDVSTPNFLLELREVKLIPRQVLRILGQFRSLTTVVRLALAAISGGVGSQPDKVYKKHLNGLKAASGAVLLSEFGVRPLVSDLSSLGKVLRSARIEANRLRENCGKTLKSHARFWVPVPGTTTATYDEAKPYCSTYRRKRTVTWTKSWYSATLEYSYELPPNVRANLDTLVLLDTLGVNLNPRIVWDAIPWSFAIDWIVKVGQFLDQFSVQLSRPVLTIHRFCHSYEAKREIVRTCTINPYLASNLETEVAREDEEYYLRTPYRPAYYSALQLSGISTREFVLAGALALSRK